MARDMETRISHTGNRVVTSYILWMFYKQHFPTFSPLLSTWTGEGVGKESDHHLEVGPLWIIAYRSIFK